MRNVRGGVMRREGGVEDGKFHKKANKIKEKYLDFQNCVFN